jgi:RNA polymerase sigma-70 factor (ECF subfamily)
MKRFKSEVLQMSDEKILELMRQNPQEGLAEAIERYSAYVYKISYSKLADVCSREDIEEAVSDIFVLFFRGCESRGFRLGSVKAFLSVIAKRHCANVFRKQSRRGETVPLEDVSDFVSADSGSDGTDRERERLLGAIHSLGKSDEEIFLRKYFLGQKSRDIAKDMNLRTNTVDKRISRGLVKLRKMLEEDL